MIAPVIGDIAVILTVDKVYQQFMSVADHCIVIHKTSVLHTLFLRQCPSMTGLASFLLLLHTVLFCVGMSLVLTQASHLLKCI